jgi:hypothetical protein
MLKEHKVKYMLMLCVKADNKESNLKAGEIVESNDVLFVVSVKNPKWNVLTAITPNKVEYIDSCKKFEQESEIVFRSWYRSEDVYSGWISIVNKIETTS